jgi:hypothetical protein
MRGLGGLGTGWFMRRYRREGRVSGAVGACESGYNGLMLVLLRVLDVGTGDFRDGLET